MPVPSVLSPMGTAMVNACAPNMLPLGTASLLVLCDSGTQAQMAFEVDVLEAHPSGGSI